MIDYFVLILCCAVIAISRFISLRKKILFLSIHSISSYSAPHGHVQRPFATFELQAWSHSCMWSSSLSPTKKQQYHVIITKIAPLCLNMSKLDHQANQNQPARVRVGCNLTNGTFMWPPCIHLAPKLAVAFRFLSTGCLKRDNDLSPV